MPDFVPGNSSTTVFAPIGATVYGTIETAGDQDWYRVNLVAGVTYEFRLHGYGLTDLTDTILSLYGIDGVTLAASNDDSGNTTWGPGANTTGGLDSRIVSFTAGATGTYFLAAQGYSTNTGDFMLTAVQKNASGMVFTSDEIAWQLINNYNDLSYRSAAWNVGADGSLSVNITALTAQGQTLALAAMRAWTDVTGINFVTTAGVAEITFDDSAAGSDAYANWNATGTTITTATVMITTGFLAQYGTTFNSYSFETYMHEIGHALGLGHGGNYNGNAAYGVDNSYLNDSVAYSIMSYMNAIGDEFTGAGDVNTSLPADFRYMLTPSISDQIAVDRLYGGSTATRTGNTTYGFNSNTGNAALDAAVTYGANMFMMVHDDGGIDTLDFSGTATGSYLNLNAGTFCNVLGGIWNLIISRGTQIENAYGGSTGDGIFGNALANTLIGNGGGDSLVGGLGSDTCYGGVGNDTLLMDDFANPSAAGGGDTGYGDANNDLLWGYGGSDFLYGGADNDSLVGNDFAVAVTGLDSLFGGDGTDQLFVGLGGNAYENGGAGNDTLYGGALSDTLRGGTGNDYLYGNTGADFFQFYAADFAANDSDIVYFMNAGDRLKFSSSLNGALFFQNIASLQYDSNPAHLTTGVYVTAFLGGGQTAHITVYGMTVASLTPLVEYTL